MTAEALQARVERWVARPAFWWAAMAVLLGGPLISGVLRRPPAPLPVLDQVPGTGRGRLVVFADPGCLRCMSGLDGTLRSLSRHLLSVRAGFDLEWVSLADAPGADVAPGVLIDDPVHAGPLLELLERRGERVQLRRSERAVLIDPRGRVRALPSLAEPPGRELLPAITQIVNGR